MPISINRFFFACMSLINSTVAMTILIFFAYSEQKIIQFICVTFYNTIGISNFEWYESSRMHKNIQ